MSRLLLWSGRGATGSRGDHVAGKWLYIIYLYDKGATGFDGSSDDFVACPGSQFPGKTTGANNNCQH